MELVIAVDTSASVDGFEYDLLMKGIAGAFRRPEIIALIGQQDGVAVTLFQWSSAVDEQNMIPWHLLSDRVSVLDFADKVERTKRDRDRRFTAVGRAIDFAVHLIAENAYEGHYLKIDVSGDGHNNTGLPPSEPREVAKSLGIVINGLPIVTYTRADSFDVDAYYRNHVIQGPGAFVEIANDYGDFANAFLRKLRREIAPEVSQNKALPPGRIQNAQLPQPTVPAEITPKERGKTHD